MMLLWKPTASIAAVHESAFGNKADITTVLNDVCFGS